MNKPHISNAETAGDYIEALRRAQIWMCSLRGELAGSVGYKLRCPAGDARSPLGRSAPTCSRVHRRGAVSTNHRNLSLAKSALQAVDLVEQEEQDDGAFDLRGFNGRLVRLPFVAPPSASARLLHPRHESSARFIPAGGNGDRRDVLSEWQPQSKQFEGFACPGHSLLEVQENARNGAETARECSQYGAQQCSNGARKCKMQSMGMLGNVLLDKAMCLQHQDVARYACSCQSFSCSTSEIKHRPVMNHGAPPNCTPLVLTCALAWNDGPEATLWTAGGRVLGPIRWQDAWQELVKKAGAEAML